MPKRLLVASFLITLMIGPMTCSPPAAQDHEQGTVGATAPDTVIAGDRPQAEIARPAAESVDAGHTRGRLIIGVAAAAGIVLALALILALVKRSNVSERKKDEGRIRQLSNVVEQTADVVIVTNREGTIEYVNPAFESTTGYTAEEAVGRSPRILKSGRQSPEFYRELWATITGGSTFRGMTINRKKNGELYHSEQTITPMTDEHGQITHFVSVNKDMTERRKVEEQAIELELASLVQQRLYPASDPDIPGYDLAGAVSPAEATSGDYYDFVLLPDGTVVIVVADVSGHGLGPALVMAETRAYVRSLTRATDDLVTITTGLNDFLFADLQDNHFVTMLLARLDPRDGRLDFVNAAHPAGAIVAGSGKLVASLSSKCLPLGMFGETWRGIMQQVAIGAGETAVFATDGVLECESPEGEAFGADRVLEVVSSHRLATAAEIVAEVHRAVREFRQGGRQEDDVTVVVCKRQTSDTVLPAPADG